MTKERFPAVLRTMDVLHEVHEVHEEDEGFPTLGRELSHKNSAEFRFQRRESNLRLPSISSLNESECISTPDDSSDDDYEGASGISSSSGFVEKNEERPGDELASKYNVVLAEDEEKEIERKVKQEFKQEFKNIKEQTLEKQKVVRRKFKAKINAARSSLLLARATAERKTIDKLHQDAEKKEADILEERKKRHKRKSGVEHLQTTAGELAALRKVRAELDRARARRRTSIATSLVASRHKNYKFSGGGGIGLPDSEIKRLEKEDEINKLVNELQNLGLNDAADVLVNSLHKKMNSEDQLMDTLKKERQMAKLKAMTRKNIEIDKLRKEKIEEKEILEREKIKREAEERARLERERLQRMIVALRRKAFNMNLRRSLDEARLTMSISKPFTYSYFDTQQ